MTATRTMSSADALLRYLWVRRTGSALQFREAAKYCFGKEIKHVSVARRLCALGHVEFDWDGPDLRWRVVRPSFFRANGRLIQCGLLLEEDARLIKDSGLQLQSYEEEFLPTCPIQRLFVDDRDQNAATLADKPLSFPVAREAYHDLLQRLAPIRNLLLRKPFEQPPAIALRFNPASRQFDQEIEEPQAEDGLIKDPGFGRPRYFFENRLVDLTTGLWLVLCDDPSVRIEYEDAGLTMSAFPELPPLFERVLYLSGAARQTLNNGRVRFSPVERGVAAMMVSRLGIRFVKGLEKA